ncbi:zinc finger, CCHC-type containing protein [Tanacetum coccineum]
MHFLLTMLKMVYVLTTPMPELVEDATVEAIKIREKWENNDYICRGHILNGMSDSLFDVYTNVESAKELWDSLESKSWQRILQESLRSQDSDKGKGKEVAGPPVNMTEEGKNKHKKQNKGKKWSNENNNGSSFNKKPKLECWKCGKTGHLKKDCHSGKKNNANAGGSGKGSKDQSQNQSQNLVPVWNIFNKYYVSLISEAFYVHVDAIAWWIDSGATTHVCKDHCWFKTYEPLEDESVLYIGDDHFAPVHGKGSVAFEFSSRKTITLFNVLYVPKLRFGYYNDGMFMLNLNKVLDDSDSVYMTSSTVVNSSLWHTCLGYVHYKRLLKISKDDLIPATDENQKKCTTCMLTKITRQPFKSITRKSVILELIHSDLCDFHATSSLGNKKVVVRLPDPKRKVLSKKGIDCIFVGYTEHFKAYRFYVIEPNDYVSINSIIESRDAIFDENRFTSIPRPKDVIPNSVKSQRDDHSDDVPIEGSRDQVGSQYSYWYNIEEDLRTYDEAMQSRDAAFWKEAIDDEIGSIMENNTWVISDLPPGCKPLGCKWIFKRNMEVDGSIDKLLLALAAIYNLVIHQMDVKTTFLNGDLDEEVNMKQPKGFVMPSNEHKVCKLVKLLYELKQEPKQWHQKFDEVVLSSGFLLNQSDKFSMKDMGEADVILGIKIKRKNKGIVITQSHYIKKILKKFNREDCSPLSTPMDLVEKLKPNTGKPVDQFEYSKAIGCLMHAMTSTRHDIAYAVGRLIRFTSNPSRQHWQAITRASKKQTYITGSTIESNFVALAAGKEAEWLRNLIHEIPICPKPIAPISIHCDSAATLAKAYSQMYNGKSRHLGVRHSMIRELLMNGVISIEFVRSQHNLADHLTKGQARDLLVMSEIEDIQVVTQEWKGRKERAARVDVKTEVFVAESDSAYEGSPRALDYYTKSGSAQFIKHKVILELANVAVAKIKEEANEGTNSVENISG